jgi:hypothetical protein
VLTLLGSASCLERITNEPRAATAPRPAPTAVPTRPIQSPATSADRSPPSHARQSLTDAPRWKLANEGHDDRCGWLAIACGWRSLPRFRSPEPCRLLWSGLACRRGNRATVEPQKTRSASRARAIIVQLARVNGGQEGPLADHRGPRPGPLTADLHLIPKLIIGRVIPPSGLTTSRSC